VPLDYGSLYHASSFAPINAVFISCYAYRVDYHAADMVAWFTIHLMVCIRSFCRLLDLPRFYTPPHRTPRVCTGSRRARYYYLFSRFMGLLVCYHGHTDRTDMPVLCVYHAHTHTPQHVR